MKQFVLFAFYLQFPETEQNNFLYTYKAQKEKTTKLSKKRREAGQHRGRRPLQGGPARPHHDIKLGERVWHAKELSPRKKSPN